MPHIIPTPAASFKPASKYDQKVVYHFSDSDISSIDTYWPLSLQCLEMALSLPTAILTIIGIAWALAVTALTAFLYRSFFRLTAGTRKDRLDEVLNQLASELRNEVAAEQRLEKEIDDLKRQLPGHLQKFGLVRFNPFTGTGGNQSFSLAILNGEGSGLVITSLHSRESTRLYAKPVKNGKSQSDLSKEEQSALRLALADSQPLKDE